MNNSSQHEVQSIRHRDIQQQLRALAPSLRKSAPDAERIRRPLDEQIRAIEATGAFRIMVPRRLDGYQSTFRQMMDITSEVAHGDGSLGWVVTLNNVCAWMVGLYPDVVQRDIYKSGPDTRVAGVLAPIGKATHTAGGYLLSGRWPYASGSMHAQWALLGCCVEGEAPGPGYIAAINLQEATIEDTWYTAGMTATGSNTVVLDNVFVPANRMLDKAQATEGHYPTEHKDEAVYRSAFVPVLAATLAGPPIGIARAALEHFIETVPKRGIANTIYKQQHEAPVTHFGLAKAMMLVDAAHMHAYRAADDIDAAAASSEYPSLLQRARVRMDTAQAIELARQAVHHLLVLGGASSMASANPIQRMWRDIQTASLHAVVAHSTNEELYGRVALGLPAHSPT